MLSDQLLAKALEHKQEFITVLDIGSGSGEHSRAFLQSGKEVTSLDYGDSYAFRENTIEGNQLIVGNYMDIRFDKKFDLIWCSHVLEHQRNPGSFLDKIREDLKEGGILCITVPPLKHNIVGGHITLWNPLLLVYNLVLARFDCRDVKIKKYGYNISVFLRKREISKMPKISYDREDFKTLNKYVPEILKHNVNGNITEWNW